MLNDAQNRKLLQKLERTLEVFDPYIFEPVGALDFSMFETSEQFHQIPPEDQFEPPALRPAGPGWGGPGVYCWFLGSFTPPVSAAGIPLYVMPRVGGYEALLWVDGAPAGTFATKIAVTRHGNHYCDRITAAADPAKPIRIAVEFYAGHYIPGWAPFELREDTGFRYTAEEILVCKKNQLVADFLYDLRVLLQLAQKLPEDSFRRAGILNALTQVHKVLYYSPEDAPRELWLDSLQRAREIMREPLSRKNGDSAPTAELIGHSHMDTAWLWPIRETLKKNARTISNQLSLMDQFPEYTFIQSSSFHTRMMEEHYPQIFEGMKKRIAEKRYEPNGAVWVECDCNITSGEAMIRQFLWGQRYTKEKFGYLSDSFWLPDTFGYSAAIPQIMKGCGVDYFLTTKLAWNDTNDFPYDTFFWEGIDGTRVLTHFFVMDTWPDPAGLLERVDGKGYRDCVRCKQGTDHRLIAFGYGDGGGGPQFEMIETARRLTDLEGCPKARYTTVTDFMQRLGEHSATLPTYAGELYLELHRGTLTGKQQIKKNNRFSELALRQLEILECVNAIREDRPATNERYQALWGTLLVNQFHDILPGSCIAEAHDESIAQTTGLLRKAAELTEAAFAPEEGDCFSVFNPLGNERSDAFYLPRAVEGYEAEGGARLQTVELLDGSRVTEVSGFEQRPLSSAVLRINRDAPPAPSPFILEGDRLETPFAFVTFDESGYMSSFIDRRTGRELCAGRYPLGCLLSAEDVSAGWDGWDVDADCMLKLAPETRLLSRRVVSNGAVELRIRSEYKICSYSSLRQDMIFYADSPLVAFENELSWNDKHRLLKAAFDTTLRAQYATHEIQFGCMKRPVTANNTFEQAMFEVCNHKYTDLSEPKSGVAILNDCKYGVSVEGGCVSLSLAKGGTRPDMRGDAGDYTFRYGFLPHTGGFDSAVTRAAYRFNVRPLCREGSLSLQPLVWAEQGNIIIEAAKPCEDAQKAVILRLYECEGSYTRTGLRTGFDCKGITLCDMLEREQAPAPETLAFRPFEIKTLKLFY